MTCAPCDNDDKQTQGTHLPERRNHEVMKTWRQFEKIKIFRDKFKVV